MTTQVRRVGHDDRSRLVPTVGPTCVDKWSTRAARSSSARPRAHRRRAPRSPSAAWTTPECASRFQELYDDYVAMIEATGADLLGSQPTQGNIAGGLSTIEEKALGNIAEDREPIEVRRCARPAEAPTRRRPVLHGHLLGRRRVRDPDGRRRRASSTCSRPGRATSSATRSSRSSRSPRTQDGRVDARAHRRRLLGVLPRARSRSRRPARRSSTSSSAPSTGGSRAPRPSVTASSR